LPSLGTISSIKDIESSFKPLLLVVFTWQDGTVLRVSTDPLNVAEGGAQPIGITGFPYNSQDFLARLTDQNLAAVQSMSQDGIDQSPTHTVTFADADKVIWLNYELTKGFKGAALAVYLAFWEPGTASFSSDFITKFVGICGSPTNVTAKGMQVSATSKLNMQKILLPTFPIQKRCANWFPTTLAAQQDGADNPDSPFYACGYSPSASGGNARGNGAFTSCTYTKAACQARGMYSVDSASRQTGRFTGVQWDPPATWRSKSYTEGKTIEGINSSNEAKYRQFVPLVYGVSFVDAVPANWQGDGNSSRGEFILCSGYVGLVYKVICNDVLIPDNNSPARAPDPLFRWNWVNQGTRNGSPNQDKGFDGLGDPYGSMAVIEVVVPRKLSDSSSIPRVRVLLQGPAVRVYSSGVPSLQPTNVPVWNMLDAFTRGPARYSDFDIPLAEISAAVCDTSISFTNLGGATSTHPRYSTSLAITQRRSLSEIIRGFRGSAKMMVVPAATGLGLIQLPIKQTLAGQQPSAVTGSNYNTAIASLNAAGGAASGYAAYDFNESNIIAGSLTFSQRTVADSPNVRTGTFQDNENEYVNDGYRIVDSVDVGRNGNQEVSTSLQIDGANSYDQILRCSETDAAETYRGNPRGDSGGTIMAQFKTAVQCAHLKAGQIVRFSEQQHSISNQLFRLMKIEPSTSNFEESSLTIQWHEDAWYLDSYGQGADPYHSAGGKQQLARPPYGWQPNSDGNLPGDEMATPDASTFSIAQDYITGADGTGIAQVLLRGSIPVNKTSSVGVPLIGQQGTTANSGGVILGSQVLYFVVTAEDSLGKQGAASPVICVVAIPSGTNANTATIPIVAWPTGAASWNVYGGPNPNTLTFQGSGSGTPSSITVGTTFFNALAYGRPDVMFDHFRIRIAEEIHGGPFGAACTGVTGTTLSFAGATFTVNQWAGRDISLVGLASGAGYVQLANLRVASNTADTLTMSGATVDLISILNVQVGDVFIMRSKPTTFSATTIGDSNFVNYFAPTGLAVDAEIGNLVWIIEGLGKGQVRKIISNTSTVLTIDREWDTIPDATSRPIVVSPSWLVDVASQPFQNDNPTARYQAQYNVANYAGRTLVVQVFTEDAGNNDSFEQDSPMREIYIHGVAGSGSLGPDGYFNDSIVSDQVQIDLANGLNHRVVLNQTAQITFLSPIFTGGVIAAGSVLYLYVEQDATGSRPTPAFDSTNPGGFISDTESSNQLDGTPSTRSSYIFTFHGDFWAADSFVTGKATS
jgi:hypothetical protein